MKTIHYLAVSCALILAAGHSAIAQDIAPAAATEVKADNPNAAEITFENEMHDYGTIKQGADGSCEFKFKNTGKEPLIITNAKGSCGCTVPTWPKEPIMKGQTGTIKVHYDTKRVGAFTKTVTLNSNAKNDPKTLTIKGVVEASEENTDQTMPVKKTSGLPLENSK
ncbi:MAG TPA: DUF1573 domain-containing protein [Bacteroidia bacterium]|nr:DUF1573 domain-containing protein [Bacteroidia bacterium]